MAAAKMDKHDLEQPDAFQEAFGKVVDYVRENRQKLYLATGVATLAIVLIAGYVLYSAHTETEASKAYFDAKLKVMMADPMGTGFAAPEAVKALEQVVEKYPSTQAAQNARYELGNLYYNAGDYDRSMQTYRGFLDKAGGKDLRKIYAWLGVGYAHEAKKEYDKALEAFTKVVDAKPGNVHEGIGYRNIARIYEEMNDRDKALDYYRKALEKTKEPAAAAILKRKIAQLG
jgi:tetratricopeptide (TPR) repeat protein